MDILITPRSLSTGEHPALEKFRAAGYNLVFPAPGAQPNAGQLKAALGNAVGWLAGVEKIGADILGAATHLKAISRNGSGVDNIDLAAAAQAGIQVLRAQGANARGVAELVFGYLLCAARNLPASIHNLKAGTWERTKGFELAGKTLGIIGCGQVGRLVARLALAFDLRVLAYDVLPSPDLETFLPGPALERFRWVSLEELLGQADMISLHCAPLADGRALIDAAALAATKRGVILINTARESLVDWPALRASLDAGQVAWYAADAFDQEPPPSFAIPQHPKVLSTAHIGGFTGESVDRATDMAVDNLLAALSGVTR